MEKEQLKTVLLDQQEIFKKKKDLIEREINIENYLKSNEITIITGVRRCGKSSLLKLISKKVSKKFVWINFDDIRFAGFEVTDFSKIEEIIYEVFETEDVIYFLDEVQNVENWQRWVNNLYAKNLKVFVTGSNSKLLSQEFSTYLTGRNKQINLSPFSFGEFLNFKNFKTKLNTTVDKMEVKKMFKQYLNIGGFADVVKNDDFELSKQYFQDIVQKDILVRHNIKKKKELSDLVLYLISNIGQIYSYRNLSKMTQIESLSQLKNYLEYLKETYLFYTLQRFDFSVKKQVQASQKIYTIDNSFLSSVAFNFSDELGKRLENLVFVELIRRGEDIYYFNEKNECDFLVKKGLKICKVLQVCYSLTKENKEREINGLLEAMEKFKIKDGIILTFEQEKEIIISKKKIKVIPVWKWLLGK